MEEIENVPRLVLKKLILTLTLLDGSHQLQTLNSFYKMAFGFHHPISILLRKPNKKDKTEVV